MKCSCAWFVLGTTMSVQSLAGASYGKHPHLNCFNGHGGTNIDFSDTAPKGLSATQCQQRCDNDKNCHCIVFEESIGKCWKRSICVPQQCEAAQGFDVYVENAKPVPANTSRNVLYLAFDDLRPDLSFYGVPFMQTPHLQKLADTGLVFDRAYVQQAVCSPSRNSFTTGRRPNSTKVWNFINHFRQASCELRNHEAWTDGVVTKAGSWYQKPENWGATTSGGAMQCCTSCSAQDDCSAWTYRRGNCTLFQSVGKSVPCPVDATEAFDTCVSGSSGNYEKWTTLPQHFRENGYMTLGVGKYYHDECNNRGGAPGDLAHPSGPGMPPMADAYLSWSQNDIQFPAVSKYEAKFGNFDNAYGKGNWSYLSGHDNGACRKLDNRSSSDYCTFNVPLDGEGVAEPLCDFITYQDAIAKMQFAAENRRQTGQPFFLVVGIRRPHLNWRVPEPYAQMYPLEEVALPKQRTMDKSINPIAYSVFPMDAPLDAGGPRAGNFVESPYETGTDNQLKELRRHYYAAVSWADFAAGQVLEELDQLGLTEDTLVVAHSDHGWHLGEYGMWEKRSNFELGTRTPLLIRAPWLGPQATSGLHTRALVELVDLYRTICDVMGIAEPQDAVPLDGVSLLPVLKDPESTVKDVALTMHPRCTHPGMPDYGARGSGGQDNTCLDVERTDFTWMGYAMRTDRYRYIEWVGWNGTSLSPRWSQLKARELYDHKEDTGAWTDADNFENVNLVSVASTDLVEKLSVQLHAAFGFPSKEPSQLIV